MTVHSPGAGVRHDVRGGDGENLFPGGRFLGRGDRGENAGAVYVSAHRAQASGHLTSTPGSVPLGKLTDGEVSRFVDEIDDRYLKFSVPKGRCGALPVRPFWMQVSSARRRVPALRRLSAVGRKDPRAARPDAPLRRRTSSRSARQWLQRRERVLRAEVSPWATACRHDISATGRCSPWKALGGCEGNDPFDNIGEKRKCCSDLPKYKI